MISIIMILLIMLPIIILTVGCVLVCKICLVGKAFKDNKNKEGFANVSDCESWNTDFGEN